MFCHGWGFSVLQLFRFLPRLMVGGGNCHVQRPWGQGRALPLNVPLCTNTSVWSAGCGIVLKAGGLEIWVPTVFLALPSSAQTCPMDSSWAYSGLAAVLGCCLAMPEFEPETPCMRN